MVSEDRTTVKTKQKFLEIPSNVVHFDWRILDLVGEMPVVRPGRGALTSQINVKGMRRVTIGVQLRRKGKVGLIITTGTNVLKTEKELAVGSGFLVELVRRKSKNLKPAASKFRLQVVQAPEVIRETSVGSSVDDENDVPAIFGEWNGASL